MNKHEYSPDWTDIIRPAILKRDNYQCRVCGIRHKSRVYKASKGNYVICDEFTEQWAAANNKRVFTLFLQVAHVNHDKSDNRPDNLMLLCPRHHSQFDAHHKKLQRITFSTITHEQPAPVLPDQLQKTSDILQDICAEVRRITAVSILRHEAEGIFNIVLKSIQNVKN